MTSKSTANLHGAKFARHSDSVNCRVWADAMIKKLKKFWIKVRGAFIIMSNLKVGILLYSIRDKMEQNMDEALKNVKAIGYDYVEFAGYFGKTKDEVKEILDKYDLKCISVHQGYF